MKNLDNKTKTLQTVCLLQFKNLIENNPCHIVTVRGCKPNLSVASDIKVLSNTTLLISCNEMIHTPDNIINNPNVVITSFNEKWAGVRLTGKAKYFTTGKYFKICNQLFNNETATPKGAIIVKISKVEAIA